MLGTRVETACFKRIRASYLTSTAKPSHKLLTRLHNHVAKPPQVLLGVLQSQGQPAGVPGLNNLAQQIDLYIISVAMLMFPRLYQTTGAIDTLLVSKIEIMETD